MANTGRAITPARVEWRSTGSNFWLAQRGDEEVGQVEFANGHFLVQGAVAPKLRSFASLADAKRAIEDPGYTARSEIRSCLRAAGWLSKRLWRGNSGSSRAAS